MLELHIPGDKSISHRAIILASLSNKIIKIKNFLFGEDCLATLNAMRTLGVEINTEDDGAVIVHGVGLHGLHAPKQKIDCGNSGTTMRLLAGVLAAQNFKSELIGDASLIQRPMRRIAEPLISMGANIVVSKNGTAPICIKPVAELHAIEYTLPVASAQVKSCLLLAGLYAKGKMQIHEPYKTRNHTELMLDLLEHNQKNSNQLRNDRDCINIPSDISSAAFFIVAALLTKHNGIVFKHIGINPTRTGLLTVLQNMGADIQLMNQQFFGNEPVADIRVMPSQLRGLTINEKDIPYVIDEIPILCIAAACAQGKTTIRGAKELRVKECDRITAMVQGLRNIGIEVEEYPDGMQIFGGELNTGHVESFGDHRIAMAFSIAQLVSHADIKIDDMHLASISFPGFEKLKRLFDNNRAID